MECFTPAESKGQNIMPNDLVQWSELVPVFCHLFPNTIWDVLTNEAPARVAYCGAHFEIRMNPARRDSIQVWGQPFVNNFPN